MDLTSTEARLVAKYKLQKHFILDDNGNRKQAGYEREISLNSYHGYMSFQGNWFLVLYYRAEDGTDNLFTKIISSNAWVFEKLVDTLNFDL